MLTISALMDGWSALGLRPGDRVLVHSAYKRFGPVEGGPEAVIRSLWRTVLAGGRGTVLFPTFNFDFCTLGVFDPAETPSQMGLLSETARRDPRFHRTTHPIYSFAVAGPDAFWLASRRYASAYGAQSVFAWLYWQDAWIVMVGLPWNNSFTFVHHVEEMEGCTYRYHKSFVGNVVGEGRGVYSMFVRDIEHGVLTAIEPWGQWMEASGVAQVQPIGAATVVAIRARDAYESIARVLKGEPRGLLYDIETPTTTLNRGGLGLAQDPNR